MEAVPAAQNPPKDMSPRKDESELSSRYEDDIFTFIIGKDRRRFKVHVSMLKCISDPLGFMMTNGQMAESIKKEAVLPDVEPITFGILVEYAYNGLCGLTKSYFNQDLLLSFLPNTLRCLMCSDSASAYKEVKQYPFCSIDCRGRYLKIRNHMSSCSYRNGYGHCDNEFHGTVVYCVVDGAGVQFPNNSNDPLFCNSCAAAAGRGETHPPYKAKPYTESDMITKCTSDFSDKKYGCSELTHDQLRDLIQRHSAETEKPKVVDSFILELAKLYVLTTKYMVADLPEICLHRLHTCLLYFDINSDSISELIKLLLYVYDNTSDEGKIVDGTGDKLRDLVIRYVVDRTQDLMQYEDFRYQMVLGAGGEPGVDFMAVMYGKPVS